MIEEFDDGSRARGPREENDVTCVQRLHHIRVWFCDDITWGADTFTVCVYVCVCVCVCGCIQSQGINHLVLPELKFLGLPECHNTSS